MFQPGFRQILSPSAADNRNWLGFHVIATARRPQVLDELKKAGMSVVALDVASPESIAACRQEVDTLTNGRLDILVNNASVFHSIIQAFLLTTRRGLTHTIPATDIDLDEVRRTFETNVFGVMAMVQAFSPLLINARGLIIMISSCSSITPYVFGSVYCASKGALNSYSRTLRQELRPFGVRVMVSLTGTVRSQIAKVERSLPPDSLYLPLEEEYKRRLLFSQNNSTITASRYAKSLVNEAVKGDGWFKGLLGGTAKWFWAGGMTTKIWLIRLLFGEWLLDALAYKQFGLKKLQKIFQQRQSKLD